MQRLHRSCGAGQFALELEKLGRRLDGSHLLDVCGSGFESGLAGFDVFASQFLSTGEEDLARFDDGFNVALVEFGYFAGEFAGLRESVLRASLNVSSHFLGSGGEIFVLLAVFAVAMILSFS